MLAERGVDNWPYRLLLATRLGTRHIARHVTRHVTRLVTRLGATERWLGVGRRLLRTCVGATRRRLPRPVRDIRLGLFREHGDCRHLL
ncbi:hypothetical protein [Promicromonospora sp. NPDC023987]|uniref:hypothetical protein n=1 Tax=Promicromonospora sp. NPDC023987 TaxID=3155360 RepID=UPI0033C25DF7